MFVRNKVFKRVSCLKMHVMLKVITACTSLVKCQHFVYLSSKILTLMWLLLKVQRSTLALNKIVIITRDFLTELMHTLFQYIVIAYNYVLQLFY